MTERAEKAEEVITYKGIDIVELPHEDLIDGLREAFSELNTLRLRLSDEGRMEAAREEDFEREIKARRDFLGVVAEYQSRMFDASTAYNQLVTRHFSECGAHLLKIWISWWLFHPAL